MSHLTFATRGLAWISGWEFSCFRFHVLPPGYKRDCFETEALLPGAACTHKNGSTGKTMRMIIQMKPSPAMLGDMHRQLALAAATMQLLLLHRQTVVEN